jgi:hypothetical protein
MTVSHMADGSHALRIRFVDGVNYEPAFYLVAFSIIGALPKNTHATAGFLGSAPPDWFLALPDL